jgi:hypothetical protein
VFFIVSFFHAFPKLFPSLSPSVFGGGNALGL